MDAVRRTDGGRLRDVTDNGVRIYVVYPLFV